MKGEVSLVRALAEATHLGLHELYPLVSCLPGSTREAQDPNGCSPDPLLFKLTRLSRSELAQPV